MAQVIGKVEELEGKFYVQDENGNIKELKLGDEVRENEIIIGDDANSNIAKLIISINGSSETIEVLSTSQLRLDNTLLNQTPDSDLVSTTKESLNEALQTIETEDNQNEEIDGEEENLELDFVDRTGDEIDINSDLRVGNILKDGAIQADFHGLQKGSNEDFGSFVDRSGNETDINSDLRQTDNGAYNDRDENGTDDGIPALFGIIHLSGETIVGEGNSATYNLRVDNAPRTDLLVTIGISHITTDDIDLSEEEIVVTIPAGFTEQTFTLDNFNDIPYDDGEEYKVTLISVAEGGYTELIIGDDEVITEIIDSIDLPVLSIDDRTLYEGDGVMVFTVSLDRVAEDDVTFDFETRDNDATSSLDYTPNSGTGVTIPAGQTSVIITVPILDDYIADSWETFDVVLSNQSSNAIIGDGVGVGTILDNSEPNTPNDDNDTLEFFLKSVSVKLVALDENGNEVPANEVNEGNPASYKVVLEDPNSDRITDATGRVEVTFSGNTATDNTDYDSITRTVDINTPFTTDTIDDYIADNGETYTVQITDDTYSNASAYENVIHDTTPVVTTILDNSQANTPNNPSDDTVEANSEAVVVKLIPTDSLGNEISPVTIGEGETAYYKAILVDPDGNQIVGATGDVDITFTDDTAIRTGTSADGELDFSATNQTVALNTVFSADSLDDYIKDSGETFDVQIVDGTYTQASIYETVTHDTTPVVTIIIDGANESDGGVTADDSVFLQLDTNDSVDEANAATLTHQFHLVDKDDNPINLALGETITLTLAYSTDGTETEDFSDKKTTVTITGNGGSDYSFDNTIVDDFLNEGDEVYTVAISAIDSNSTSFENIKIADTANGANSTVNSATGTIQDGVNDTTPNETDNDTVYAVLTGDSSVIEGNTANYTVQLLDINGNPVTVSQNTVVNVTFTNSTTQDADTEYTNNQVIPVTIIAGTSSIALDADTVDDYLSDNNEDYTLTISSIPSHEFEAIDIDGFTDSGSNVHLSTQTTTITDNTGTPNDSGDGEEESTLDEVIIKLVACDLNGDPILLGNDYVLANSVYEGETPNYMALAFVPGTTDFNTTNKLPNSEQDGTVDVTLTDASAQGASSLTTLDGSEDFNNSGQTVSIGVAFSTATFDDFTPDDGQTFNVQITDGSYIEGTVIYENVDIDTTAVVTTIYDDISIGTPDNVYIDEDEFDVTLDNDLTGGKHNNLGTPDADGNSSDGSETSLNIVTVDGSKDDYSLIFDNTITPTLTSSGTAIAYDYSTPGTVIGYLSTGNSTDNKVFEVTLNKNGAGGSDDKYVYTQYENIDHPTADVDDTITFDLGFKVVDDGQTSFTQDFTVTVNDSLPEAISDSRTTPEDTDLLIVISDESFENGEVILNNGVGADVTLNTTPGTNTIDILDNAIDQNVVGVVENNGDGTLTFKPNENFSGNTLGFSYNGIKDSDQDSASGTIDLTVTPVADTPDMNGTNANLSQSAITTAQTTEDVNNSSEGNQITTVGFILPTNEDGASTPGDYTGDNTNDDEIEKFGLISIISTDGITISANGSDYTFSGGNPITVYINDVVDYHHAEVGAGDADISLTQAQFEAIQVKHAEDDAVNPTFTISVDSYELNDDDTLKSGPISANNTQDYEVDILAVTDPVILIYNHNDDGDANNKTDSFGTLTEGATLIDLGAKLTATFGDTDGSERHFYTVSGIPEGTIIEVNSTKVAAGPDGIATVEFTGDATSFNMTVSEQFSGNINGTITLKALDTDDDSTGTITEQSDSVTFTASVNPVADIVTLQVKQAIGDEDAGRLTGNSGNDANASIINDAENGINLDIKVSSDDDKDLAGAVTVDEKEVYVVTIDSIPEDGSIYYSDVNGTITITRNADNTTTTTGSNANVTMDSDDGTTWTIRIEDFDNDAPLKFIPPHNDDSDYVFNVNAYSIDSTDDSLAEIQTLQIDVTVNEVADIPVNDTLSSTTVTDDNTNNNSFTLSSAEDGLAINLKTVLATPATLESYDKSVANAGDGSETLTIKVTNLADGFDIQGATFLGGTGTSRVWFVDLADLQADAITLTSPQNFAGETNFDIAMVTTEDAGDSKTHDAQEVSLLITPLAEASVNTNDTQDEDTPLVLDFGLTKPDSDGSSAGEENLKTFAINMDTVDAGVTLVGSVSGTLSGSGYQALSVVDGVLETVTATITEDSNMGGSYDFNIQYTIDDVAVDNDGNKYTNTKTVTDETYTVTVNAITDDIDLSMTTTTGVNNSVDGSGNVTVTGNGIFTKTLNVVGLDSDTRGSLDEDSSEQFTRVTVSGVPEGITVGGANGVYAGDTGGGNYSGFWYVDIPNQALDGTTSYDLTFDVDGSFSGPDVDTYNIIVTAYNEDNNNSVEQSDSETFDLTIANDIGGSGAGTPATILAFYQDIDNDATQDHAYTVTTTSDTNITDADAYEGSVLREDTIFQLSDVVHVQTDNTVSDFSITIKNVPAGLTIEGMTYNSAGDFYTYSSSGNQATIVTALSSIDITPILNENTKSGNISNTDLNFDIELTTYATGGASNTALINFTASVLPVTDDMDLSVVNDGTTQEDTAQEFSITLDNVADGSNFTIVDGTVYLQLTENFGDTQGTDGTSGTLKYEGSTITTQAVSGVSGISDGNYYVITGVNPNDVLNFTYEPAEDRNGSVDVDVFVKNIESETWNPFNTGEITSTKTISFDVTAVEDGFSSSGTVTAIGDEDESTANAVDGLIEVDVSSISNPDSSELLFSISLDKIPDGFLVYYGVDEASAVVAQNIGLNGTMTMQMTYAVDETVDYNLWNIPLDSGQIPNYIGIKAPENWSGTIPDVNFVTTTESGTSTTNTFDVLVNPVVDTLSLNATQTFGKEGEDIELKLNANVDDLDGSETVTLTLTGLGSEALFKADGVAIDNTNIDYTADTYTIANIAALDLNKLTVVQSQLSTTTINVTAVTVETNGGATSSPVVNDSFDISISESIASSGDDTLLYKSSALDGLDGNDNIVLGGKTLDFAHLDNIETLDLGAGDNTISGLSLDDVLNMTDTNNSLTIIGDENDELQSVSTSGWSKDSETDNGDSVTYEYSKGADTVTLTVDDNVNNTGL